MFSPVGSHCGYVCVVLGENSLNTRGRPNSPAELMAQLKVRPAVQQPSEKRQLAELLTVEVYRSLWFCWWLRLVLAPAQTVI
jgi:hypothetical protein